MICSRSHSQELLFGSAQPPLPGQQAPSQHTEELGLSTYHTGPHPQGVKSHTTRLSLVSTPDGLTGLLISLEWGWGAGEGLL